MDFVKIERAGVVKSISKTSWELAQKSLAQQGWSQISNFSTDTPSGRPEVKKQTTEPVKSFVPPEIANTKTDLADPNAAPAEKTEPAKEEKVKSKGGRPKKS